MRERVPPGGVCVLQLVFHSWLGMNEWMNEYGSPCWGLWPCSLLPREQADTHVCVWAIWEVFSKQSAAESSGMLVVSLVVLLMNVFATLLLLWQRCLRLLLPCRMRTPPLQGGVPHMYIKLIIALKRSWLKTSRFYFIPPMNKVSLRTGSEGALCVVK